MEYRGEALHGAGHQVSGGGAKGLAGHARKFWETSFLRKGGVGASSADVPVHVQVTVHGYQD